MMIIRGHKVWANRKVGTKERYTEKNTTKTTNKQHTHAKKNTRGETWREVKNLSGALNNSNNEKY